MILNYLDASTCHITEQDNELLGADSTPSKAVPFRVSSHEYGWLIFLSDEEYFGEVRDDDLSDDFVALVKVAQREKCALINLDRDADVLPELNVNEW